MSLEKQNAMMREMQLPISVLVYSGGKSLHAIVKIDAADYSEYRKRVDYLYDVCRKNGMAIDTQNRNPSRLSRLPGVTRGDKKQFIVDTNIGKTSWAEWKDWIDSINDDLPDIEDLADVWSNIPDLAPCLIDGVLRKGHKMLISGPSKAGKSFLQIELAIAIAEGKKWLQWNCAQGRVMYVNLELDRASCLHRFKDVYTALGWEPSHLNNIDIWNLRGQSAPMDKLAPRLIRRAKEKNYAAVIIDPIYKVITGDENSASEMAKFCNQFDKIAKELECAVIYCHHHSKGMQGGKRAMDRASGSGVFARDPDALLDMIELPTPDVLQKQQADRAACDAIMYYLEHCALTTWDWKEEIGPDDRMSLSTLTDKCKAHLLPVDQSRIRELIEKSKKVTSQKTAWRIDGILREFPKFDPVNIWFNYPIHEVDEDGLLADINPEEEKTPYQRMLEAKKKQSEKDNAEKISQFAIAFDGLVDESGCVRLKDIAEEIGVSQKTIGAWLGAGKRGKTELKKEFVSFTNEDKDHARYVKRKE
jgi:RecA-family ATPase